MYVCERVCVYVQVCMCEHECLSILSVCMSECSFRKKF